MRGGARECGAQMRQLASRRSSAYAVKTLFDRCEALVDELFVLGVGENIGPVVLDGLARLTHCRHWLHRWVRPKIYSLADLLGGLMSTINAATICIAAAKANGTT